MFDNIKVWELRGWMKNMRAIIKEPQLNIYGFMFRIVILIETIGYIQFLGTTRNIFASESVDTYTGP